MTDESADVDRTQRAIEERSRYTCFVGVDLGGGKSKHTAVALLQRADHGARVVFVGRRNRRGRPFYDEELSAFIRSQGAEALLAIDAPLTVPACIRCVLPRCVGTAHCDDPAIAWFRETGEELLRRSGTAQGKPLTTPYTQRPCELMMQKVHGIQPREALGQGMGPLTARAHYLRRALESDFTLNENMIEVFPKATIQALCGADCARYYKREVNVWRTRARILEALSDNLSFEVWREGCLRDDHCFDAVICAYTAYLWAAEGWVMSGPDAELFASQGWVWFPTDRNVSSLGKKEG